MFLNYWPPIKWTPTPLCLQSPSLLPPQIPCFWNPAQLCRVAERTLVWLSVSQFHLAYKMHSELDHILICMIQFNSIQFYLTKIIQYLKQNICIYVHVQVLAVDTKVVYITFNNVMFLIYHILCYNKFNYSIHSWKITCKCYGDRYEISKAFLMPYL